MSNQPDKNEQTKPEAVDTTIKLSQQPPLTDTTSDGATTHLSDVDETVSLDEGGTVLLSDVDETGSSDEGGTVILSDVDETGSSDEGGTVILSDVDETGSSDEGGTVILSDMGDTASFEEGGTVALDHGHDDGATQNLSSNQSATLSDDGGTIPMSDISPTSPNDDDGRTTDLTSPQPRRLSKDGTINIGELLQHRYRVKKILGRGGFGAAFLAEDVRLSRLCVVKQMLIPRNKTTKQIEQLKLNFAQEAKFLATLNQPGHPNIPEIYDYFPDDTGLYLVMKYIEGQDLAQLIKGTEGQLPWREGVRYVMDVCDALDYMHAQGDQPVLHRDIKPANILLGNDGRLWLIDFGLATEDARDTESSGSPGYTPLEQWLGRAEPASDIYATGVTLHHLITGVNPTDSFEGKVSIKKLRDLHSQLPPLDTFADLDDDLPTELNAIIQSATAAEVADRPTANQLKSQLELLIKGGQGVGLFTFKNGVSAQTIDQLVDLCERNGAEARGYLYNGDFQRWFTLINRNDLAEAALNALKKHPRTQRAGLERFLKLIRPGLFWRRLRKAGSNFSKVAAVFLLALLLVSTLMVMAGAYSSRYLLRWAVASYPWTFYTMEIDEENVFDEAFLTENLRLVAEPLVLQPQVDLRPPNYVNLQGRIFSYEFDVPLLVTLEDEKPQIAFIDNNQWLEFFITDNIAQGINDGIDDVFADAPVDYISLAVDDEAIFITIEESNRAPWLTPTPGPPPTPTPRPTPTPTATPTGPALIVVFNNLGRPITLQIGSQSWNIAADNTGVVEIPPGVYNYTIRYQENGQLAAEGLREWEVRAYRWYLEMAEFAEFSEDAATN